MMRELPKVGGRKVPMSEARRPRDEAREKLFVEIAAAVDQVSAVLESKPDAAVAALESLARAYAYVNGTLGVVPRDK